MLTASGYLQNFIRVVLEHFLICVRFCNWIGFISAIISIPAWRKTAFVPRVYESVNGYKVVGAWSCRIFTSSYYWDLFPDPTCRATLSVLHFPKIIFIFASSFYLQNYHTCLFILFVSPLYAAWVSSPTHTPTHLPNLFIPSIHLGSLWDLYLEGRERNNLKGYWIGSTLYFLYEA